jgi:hypothetical protein
MEEPATPGGTAAATMTAMTLLDTNARSGNASLPECGEPMRTRENDS